MPYQLMCGSYKNGKECATLSEPIREVFRSFGIEEFGSMVYVELADGMALDCLTSSLTRDMTTGFTFEFRSVSKCFIELVYALCKKCQLVAVIVDNPCIALVCDRTLIAHVPLAITAKHEPAFCESSEDVARQICPGFDRWSDWAGR